MLATSKLLLRSILSGIFISIGAIVYMNSSNNVVGAFMFSIGLLSIFLLKLPLFTGIVPYVNRWNELPALITVLVGNSIGCSLMFLFPSSNAVEVIQDKLYTGYLQMFVSAVLCNILIFVAVEASKQEKTITVIFAVATFVMCGFNHSIANMCFVAASGILNTRTFLLILVSILGNTFGGISIRKVIEYANSKDRKKLHS